MPKVIGVKLKDSDVIRYTSAADGVPLSKWFRLLAERELFESTHERCKNKMSYHEADHRRDFEYRIQAIGIEEDDS